MAKLYPNVRRTVIALTTLAVSTATVIGSDPVLSNVSSAIVSGPPTTAVASALMPTMAQITGGSACTTSTVASSPANILPSNAPSSREAKNNPPRNPDPMLIADAADFSRISRPRCCRL